MTVELEVDMKALTALQDEATGLLNQDTETSEESECSFKGWNISVDH